MKRITLAVVAIIAVLLPVSAAASDVQAPSHTSHSSVRGIDWD